MITNIFMKKEIHFLRLGSTSSRVMKQQIKRELQKKKVIQDLSRVVFRSFISKPKTFYVNSILLLSKIVRRIIKQHGKFLQNLIGEKR